MDGLRLWTGGAHVDEPSEVGPPGGTVQSPLTRRLLEVPVRPVLSPALQRYWRDPQTLQLGFATRRATVLTGLAPQHRPVLRLLDGALTREQVVSEAGRAGCPSAAAEELLGLLERAELLIDADALQAGLAGLDPPARQRLAPEATALALLHGAAGGPALLARRRARVRLHGPLAADLAALLERSGVGAVDAVGDDAAGSRRLAPADLLVLTADDEPSRRQAEAATTAGLPHLLAVAEGTTGTVGPLVVGGETSCLQCQDLSRSDRDPGWPALAVQRAARPARVPADGVLAAAVVAQAGLQVLQLLEGLVTPASVDGTLEMTTPDWRWRRRSWPQHPDCPCAAAAPLRRALPRPAEAVVRLVAAG